MKSEPYTQFIGRNSYELMELMRSFHEVNRYYGNQLLLTLDATDWELFDLRISRPLLRVPFKKLNDLRLYLRNLYYDMSCIRMLNSIYNGSRKLKKSELYSCRRILNLYGFDDFFINNKQLINYIIHAELQRNKK